MTTNFSFLSKHKLHVSSSMVLIVCTVLALICANIPVVKDWYFSLWQHNVSVSIGNFNLFSHNGHPMTLMAVINDFLMAIFFLSVGLEIKREIRVGELSTREKALLPIIGACGGMIVPVLLFWLTCPGDAAMQRGLAIPMATDIAFSLGVLSVFSKRVPIGLKVFLAALAVADDLGGIIVIALFYSSDIDFLYLALSAACVAVMVLANILKVRRKAFYVTIGLVLWYRMLKDLDGKTVAAAVYKHISSCKFPPTIADIREQCAAIESGGEKNWLEGWGMVVRAIGRHGMYGRKEAMKKLRDFDPLTADVVEKMGWQNLCESENQVADRANFRIAYEAYSTRKKELAKLPPNLANMITGISEQMMLKGD